MASKKRQYLLGDLCSRDDHRKPEHSKMNTSIYPQAARIRASLLAWYDAHRRDLPWRAKSGARVDPYAVWLSEIMLQQTTVATVGPYFGNFKAQWPTVGDMAAGSLDDILVAWQGLGYYARARNLYKCAGVVVSEHGGVFPETEDELRKLPGIGPYTAAAIASIAFDQPCVPVDGNIERVTARLYDIDIPLPKGKKDIHAAAQSFISKYRPGDFAQAMMDLGSGVCAPRSPKCEICPLNTDCQAYKMGNPARLPVKAPKKVRPERCCVVFWLENADGDVLMQKRPETGLLGGMTGFVSTSWREGAWPEQTEIETASPLSIEWAEIPGEAVHVFTHFRLTMRVLKGKAQKGANVDGFWVAPTLFAEHALPTVMKKVIKLVGENPS